MNTSKVLEKPVAFPSRGVSVQTLLWDARRGRNYGS